jgi:hypothetical protein
MPPDAIRLFMDLGFLFIPSATGVYGVILGSLRCIPLCLVTASRGLSIGTMALDTQVFLPAQLKVVFIIRAHWVMAAYTSHHLPSAVIENLFPHGVAELALGLMAPGAAVVSSLSEHSQVIRSMNRVATFAVEGSRMDVESVLIPLEGVFVAAPADITLASFEEIFLIARVRGVACGAAVYGVVHKVTVNCTYLPSDFFVATETVFGSHPTLAVALRTALFER